jgi:DNA-directed RNA polymerase specialized sigma24 family protein
MTPIILDRGARARVNITSSGLEPRLGRRPVRPAAIARQEMRRGTTFEADLVAQLSVLRRYARKLTHDGERALDLVQDTCERALRFRHLFREGTNLQAWVLTIMRHHFLDMAKRGRDAMASGKGVPLEELSEWPYSDPRAEQICFVKEALGLASQRFLAHLGGRDPEGVCSSLWDSQGDGGHSPAPRPVLHAARLWSLMEDGLGGAAGAQPRSDLEHEQFHRGQRLKSVSPWPRATGTPGSHWRRRRLPARNAGRRSIPARPRGRLPGRQRAE